MAIIKCKECGKEISNKATVCTGCGAPAYVQHKEFKMNKDILVVIAVVAVVVIGYFGYDYYQGKQLAYPNGYPGGTAQWQQDMRDQMNGKR